MNANKIGIIALVGASLLSPAIAANITLGPGTTVSASTNQFMAIGDSNQFGVFYPQFAVGDFNIFNDESTGAAIGWGNEMSAGSYASLAVGNLNEITSPYSIVVGEANQLNDDYQYAYSPGSAVFGNYNEVDSHMAAFVSGYDNKLLLTGVPSSQSGMGGMVVGLFNEVDANSSWVLGVSNLVSGEASSTIGWSLQNSYQTAVVVGSFNKAMAGSESTWQEDGPAFVVGNGNMSGRSNAIETLKNGETTLVNKAWNPAVPLATPSAGDSAEGRALVVEGHTLLKGKVVIEQPQGDIPMFTGN